MSLRCLNWWREKVGSLYARIIFIQSQINFLFWTTVETLFLFLKQNFLNKVF